MIARERTRQQLDPIGTFGNGLETILLSASAFVLAVVTTYEVFDQIAEPPLAVVALLVLGVACGAVIYASSAYRAPFSRRTHDLVIIGALVAIVIDAASEGFEQEFTRNDWGPVVLGLLLLAMGPYRPAREQVVSASLAAIFVGFITVVQGRLSTGGLPVVAMVAVTVMPILALGYASAANSHRVVNGLERWQHKLMRPGRVVSREDEDGIARSVQQDRITILNREVLPFFLEIIEKPAVSNADRERARDIAASIRRVMVAEVDRSWLENALQKAGTQRRGIAGGAPVQQELRDDEHIAGLMAYDQRTALRAFIGALHEVPASGPEFIRMELFRDGAVCRGIILVALEMADFTLRSRFAPYFAVLRVMFADLRLEYLQGVLTLSFSYEQR